MQARNTYLFMKSLSIIVMLFVYIPAFSQDKVDTTKIESRTLDETVVTAKFDRKTLRSTSPVFSLDKERLLKNGITDISDAVHRLPGVTLRDYGGAGGMKTVSVRGLGSAHTVVIYDGMMLSDAQSGSIDLSRYSVDNLDELSLVVGDNDDIFISAKAAASPATLMLTTPGLSLSGKKFDVTSQVKTGSFGYINPYIRGIMRPGNKVALGFTGEFTHTKNNYPFNLENGTLITKEKRSNNRMNSGHVELNLRGETGYNGEYSAKLYYYDNNRQLPGPVILYNIDASTGKLQDRNSFGQMSFLQQLGSKWKMKIAGKYNWSESLYTETDKKYTDGKLEQFYWQREAYLTGQLLYNATDAWSFDYSADYIFNSLNSNDDLTDARPHRNSFLQSITAKWNIGRVIIMSRLVQSNYINSCRDGFKPLVNHSRISPSLGVSGRLLRSGFLYGRLSYKNIFRMPTFNEAFYNRYGNPYLKPESTHQFNAGLTYQAPSSKKWPYFVVTGDVYRNYVHNRIVAIPQNMFIWSVANLNSVNVIGADITINGTANICRDHDIVVSGTWSYQRATIDADDNDPVHGCQVAYIPLNSGSGSIGYENPWVNIVVHGRGSSERYTSNSNNSTTRLPGYFETGITLWRKFHTENWGTFELRGDIINLLNKQYAVIARYPMPGRSWMLTMKYSI